MEAMFGLLFLTGLLIAGFVLILLYMIITENPSIHWIYGLVIMAFYIPAAFCILTRGYRWLNNNVDPKELPRGGE